MPLMVIRNAQGDIVRTEDWPRNLPPPVLAEGETAVRWKRGDGIVFAPSAAPEPPAPAQKWSAIDAEGIVQRIILWDGKSDIDLDGLTARPWQEGDEPPAQEPKPFDYEYALERIAIEQLKLDYLNSFNAPPEATPEPEQPKEEVADEPVEQKPDVLGPLEELLAKIDRVRATGSVDPSGVDDIAPLNTDDLINMVADNPPGSAAELEEAVRAIKGEARRRFSEQLNVELAELKNSRGLAGEDLQREQQVEYLLGLFARLGEI